MSDDSLTAKYRGMASGARRSEDQRRDTERRAAAQRAKTSAAAREAQHTAVGTCQAQAGAAEAAVDAVGDELSRVHLGPLAASPAPRPGGAEMTATRLLALQDSIARGEQDLASGIERLRQHMTLVRNLRWAVGAVVCLLCVLGSTALHGWLAQQRFQRALASADAAAWQEPDARLLSQVIKIDNGFGAALALSPDRELVASGSSDGALHLWRVADGSRFRTLSADRGLVWDIVFSPDGQLLAAGSRSNAVQLWQVTDGGVVRVLEGHSDSVNSVAFSPDGALLASGSADDTVRLWRVADRSLVRSFDGHSDSVTSVAFSPDGTLLASGSADGTVRLWRVADGSLVRSFEGDNLYVNSVAFSPDGALLASGSSDTAVRLWRVEDGDLVSTLDGHRIVYRVSFSSNGQLLAAAAGEVVQIWRVSDGSLVRVLEAHSRSVSDVAFSQDGVVLASTSADGTMRLWVPER